MITRRRFALATAVLVLAAGAVSGAEPRRGGALTYTFHPEPVAVSTIATTAVPVALGATKIYESLLTYEGPGLKPAPGLAESWTVSPDHRAYTFRLRPGVRWHDGKPFTSADVKFSIEKVVVPYHSRGKTYFGELESLETPDPRTVVFRLKTPVPFFMSAFQPSESPILPKHLVEKLDVNDKDAVRKSELLTTRPVGTGPFRLKEWKKGSHLVLERNPDYWRKGQPYLDQVILRVIPDGAARALALEEGEIDLAPMSAIPNPEIPRLAGLRHVTASTEGAEALGPIMWLELNLRKKPLSDVRVRQALSLALDRKRIVDVIWFGQGKPATGPIVSANPIYYDRTLKPLEYDPRKAERLLDEAGYPRGAGGVRFKLVQNYLPYGEAWVRMAEYIRQEFRKVGIEVETQALDMGGWLKRIYTDWDHDFTSNFTHNYADPAIGVRRAFTSASIKKGASFTNSMDYRNPRVDELFRLAETESSLDARKKELAEVQQILQHDLPVIFVMEMAYTHLWNKRVQGLITNGVSMYSNWDSVWVQD
jgi:peptide/nickel transport system substrate-binding protein